MPLPLLPSTVGVLAVSPNVQLSMVTDGVIAALLILKSAVASPLLYSAVSAISALTVYSPGMVGTVSV